MKNHQNSHLFWAILTALFMACSPVIAYAQEEDEGPELDTLSLETTLSAPGAQVKVYGVANDPDGIQSFYASFLNEKTGDVLTVPLHEAILYDPDGEKLEEEGQENSDPYAGVLTLPTDLAPGVYRLDNVVLIDNKGNRSRYLREGKLRDDRDGDHLLESALSLTVGEDSTAPVPLACHPVSGSVKPGEKTVLELTLAPDTSGLERGSLTFENQANGRRIICTVDSDVRGEDGLYRPELEIPAYEPAGTFRLLRVTLKDRAGNERTYATNEEEDSLPLGFVSTLQVGAGQTDSAPPVLESVTVGESRENGNDQEFRVWVKAADDDSGLASITLRFENPANSRSASLTLGPQDLENGTYTGWLKLNRFEPAGTFELDAVGLRDNAGNYQGYCRPADVKEENHKLPLPKPVSLTPNTQTTALDECAPVLESISVSPEQAVTQSKVVVTAQISDDLSGVDEVKAKFQSAQGKAILVTLKRDGDAFVGNIKKTQTQQEGVYRLTRLTATDNAGNRRAYYKDPDENGEPLPCEASFTLEKN